MEAIKAELNNETKVEAARSAARSDNEEADDDDSRLLDISDHPIDAEDSEQ